MLTRSYSLSDATVKGRTLDVAVVPFDVPAYIDDGDGPYREVFRRGAFAHVVEAPNRTELRYEHEQSGPPYGFATDLREDTQHLLGSFRVAPSDAGDMLLGLVGDGQLRGVSVGFFPGTDRSSFDGDGPLLERVKVKRLKEVSLVVAATYSGAGVLAVRGAADLSVIVERECVFWQRVRAANL